jgi:hypothetical protein
MSFVTAIKRRQSNDKFLYLCSAELHLICDDRVGVIYGLYIRIHGSNINRLRSALNTKSFDRFLLLIEVSLRNFKGNTENAVGDSSVN